MEGGNDAVGVHYAGPQLEKNNGFNNMPAYSVTENGQQLIAAQSLPAQQQCFLRSLLAHQLPSALEPTLSM
jgi:hypothetical protein